MVKRRKAPLILEEENFKQEVETSFDGSTAKEKGLHFAMAVLENAFGLDPDNAWQAASCDQSLDKGLDAYYSDSDFFYLMQFNYHDGLKFGDVSVSTASKTLQICNCWPYISDKQQADKARRVGKKAISERLYDASLAFETEVIGQGKKVVMRFVEWRKGDTAKAETAGKACVRMLKKYSKYFHKKKPFEVWSFDQLKDAWLQQTASVEIIKESVSLKYITDRGRLVIWPGAYGFPSVDVSKLKGSGALYSRGNVSQSKKAAKPSTSFDPTQCIGNGPFPDGFALAVNVKGQAILDIYHEYGTKLFDPNVRFEIPDSTPVSTGIKRTIEKESEFFWYFNNGITLLCSDIEETALGELILKYPGVVNGCQTIMQVKKAVIKKRHFEILVKVIKSQSGNLDSYIARFTNSQNQVKPRDLASYNPEQHKYVKMFDKLKPQWYFDIKRGAWKILGGRKRRFSAKTSVTSGPFRRIDNRRASKAVLAFSCSRPVEALVSVDNRFMDTGKESLYHLVFRTKRCEYELLASTLVYNAVESKKRACPNLAYAVPHVVALIGQETRKRLCTAAKGTLTRKDFKHIHDKLVDGTGRLATSNFISTMVDRFYCPFLRVLTETWKKESENAGQEFSPSKFFKNLSRWSDPAGAITHTIEKEYESWKTIHDIDPSTIIPPI